MNIEIGSGRLEQHPQPKQIVFEVPEPSNGSGLQVLAENVAQLEKDLDAEREGRHEERFYWICGVAFLLDILAIKLIDSFPHSCSSSCFSLCFLSG